MARKEDYIPIETSEFHGGGREFNCTLIIAADAFPQVEVEIGTETLKMLADSIGDHPSQSHLFSCLAFHPAASVRESVAKRNFLSDGAVMQLMNDSNGAVRLALFWSAAFRRIVKEDWLIVHAEADAGFALDLIREIEEFSEVETSEFLQKLSRFSDPSVRNAVAQRREVGRATLRQLSNDPDPEVRLSAMDTIAS